MSDKRFSTPASAAGHPLDRYSAPPPQAGGGDGGDQSPFFKSAAPSISMPKGGGALKGIDEKFSVNAVNGTAGLQIALPLTPGRSGFTPALALSYNSGSGASPFGLGWSLGLPSIRRKTDRQLPLYDDEAESDVFLLAGAEDLLPQLFPDDTGHWLHDERAVYIQVPGAAATQLCLVKRYRPRIEGLFARIEHIRGAAQGSWWRVTSKDNITTWYGLTAGSRIADPADASRIFEWLPELAVDGKGAVQQYVYKPENFDNVPAAAPWERNRANGIAPCTNLYLKSVRYCNLTPFSYADPYAPALPAAASDFLMEAVLDYGEHGGPGTPEIPVYTPAATWGCRTDAFSDYRAGFEIRTWRRCSRVLQFYRFAELGAGPTVVRSLDLSYTDGGAASPGGPAEACLLTSATQTGYMKLPGGDWQRKSLPAMTLDYRPLQWDDTLHSVAPDDVMNAPQGLTGPYQWTDLWGEGLPGILTEQGDGWWYKSNLGDGHFSPAAPVAQIPSFRGLATGALQLADLDADGGRQAVSRAPGAEGFFELDDDPSATAGQRWQPFRAFKDKANVNWNSPYTKLLDLDGDGRPDLLLTEDRIWTWYKNKGREGFAEGGQQGVATDEEHGPRLILRDDVQSVFLADMSGDGLTDLVRIRNAEVCYWPNLGRGRFGAKVSMGGAPVFDTPDAFNPLYLQLADISGTGAADLVYLGAASFRVWINLAGNAFAAPRDLASLPGIEPYSKVGVMDFLGNGTGCIVWSSPLPQYSAAPLRYVDLMGGVKPYLMTAYHNGMGKTVSLGYRSSTQYYLADKAAGTPWATRLPFPVQCVDTVSTTDAVSETVYTQHYSYHHGYYDHEEREFRGFGRVETIDTDIVTSDDSTSQPFGSAQGGRFNASTLSQPPVLTKTWYHTGAWIREGSLLDAFAAEYYHFAGWNTLGTQAAFELDPGDPDIALLEREAHRAMKGSALRQEVYALDDSAKADKPYAVTVSAYTVKLVQPLLPRSLSGAEAPGGATGTRHASFRTEGQQSLSWSCERDPADARLAHSLTLETDRWGNVLQSAQVAYPRFSPDAALPAAVRAEQAKMHVVCSVAAFTNDIGTLPLPGAAGLPESVAYRLRLPCEAMSYELSGYAAPAGLWTPAALKAALDGAAEIDYAASPSGTVPEKRLISHSHSRFAADAAPATALAAGALESLALPYEHYTLALTQDTRSVLYGTRVSDAMLTEGGYTPTDSNGNWWIPSGTAQYDASPAASFYLPVSFTDPWGNVTSLSYWEHSAGTPAVVTKYCLLPAGTTDALGNISTVDAYDWRILQPAQMTDANGNISRMAYDALGMPVAAAIMGKGTEADYLQELSGSAALVADSTTDLAAQAAFWGANTAASIEAYAAILLGKATWRCIYDLSSSPTAVAMIGREQHYEADHNSPTIVRITYTDGFGRVIMHKARAADDPATGAARWIGSGRTVYNNKGKPVMQFEPYFSLTHACDTAAQAAAAGNSPKMYYDPLGRLRRTELPDGTFSHTEWDNWSQTVYDSADTVLQSDWHDARTGAGSLAGIAEEADAAGKAAKHDSTPALMYLDSLARPFYTVHHNRTPDSGGVWQDDLIHSYEVLDITGNRLAVHDGRGLTPLTYKYNLVKAPAWQHSIDGGDGYMLTDVGGQPLYHWDAAGKVFHSVYDALRRPLAQWGDGKKLGKIIYGEGAANDKANNLRGQVIASYDGAGKHYVDAYDFKGQPLKSYMRLLVDGTLANADWDTLGGSALVADEVFFTEVITDALGRPLSADSGRIIGTTTTTTEHNITTHTYEKDGALKTVKVGSDTYVQDIRHNAKGQREAIWYGNGTKTSYTYDDKSHRLTRLLTVKLSTNDKLQDLNYFYDAVGNITIIRDDAQETVFFSNTIITPQNEYTYDALYRLIKAKGRESISAATFGSSDNTGDAQTFVSGTVPWDGSSTALQHYTQYYSYDAVGNILQLQHSAGAGSYTRTYGYGTSSNRLVTTQIGSATPYTYSHDTRGNMSAMPHLSVMNYDLLNQMSHVTADTVEAYYQYSGGQRVRKYLDKGSSVTEERIYYGSYEVYRKWSGTTLSVERTTQHVADDSGRIAMIEKRTIGTSTSDGGTPALLKRFIYSNHLQSAALELDEAGAIISYEEYHPYGTTAYQAMNATINAVAKRYRYTGKERDEESGLNYHGARYYAPWLARWCAVDPLESKYTPWSSYCYVHAIPTNNTDSTGMGDDLPDNPRNRYGEKQVYQQLHAGKHPYYTTVTPSGPGVVGISQEMSDVQLYRLAVYRISHPGEYKIGEGEYLDEKYLKIESHVENFLTHLISSNMSEHSDQDKKTTLDAQTRTVLALFSDNDKLESEAIKLIERRNTWGAKFSVRHEAAGIAADVITFGASTIERKGMKAILEAEKIAAERAARSQQLALKIMKASPAEYNELLGLAKTKNKDIKKAAELTRKFAEGIDKQFVDNLNANKLTSVGGLKYYESALKESVKDFKLRGKDYSVQQARLETIQKILRLWN